MLACSFLIESSSKLLVTRTGMKAWSSSILGRIRPLSLELLALEWQKFHTFELEYLWSQLVNLDQILCVASLGWGKSCIRFWGRLTWHIGLRWAIVALWATCLAHLSRRLTRWAYRMGLEPASVRPCVRVCVRPCVHTFKHEYLRDQQADYNQILSEASLGWGKGCIRFWCRSDQNSGFHGNG